MNGYGKMAQDYWAEWLPLRYSQLDDPEAYFEELGREVATEVETLYSATAKPPSNLSEQETKGWLAMARLNAKNQVLSELVYLPPEEEEVETLPDSSFPHVIEVQTLQEIYDEESLNPYS